MEVQHIEKIEGFFKQKDKVRHFSLLDPSANDVRRTLRLAKKVSEEGTDAIVVGGSDSLYTSLILKTIKLIKKYEITSLENVNYARIMANRLPSSMVKGFCSGNTLLAGTAGGIIKPLSLGGIYLGMLSGKAAAEAVLSESGCIGYSEFIRSSGMMARLREDFVSLKAWQNLTDRLIRTAVNSIISKYGREPDVNNLTMSGDATTGITGILKFLMSNMLESDCDGREK